jgi:acetyl esterase/lipase
VAASGARAWRRCNRLAKRGWVCVSATYRLRPGAGWQDHLVDAKPVIAWAR